MKNKIYFLRFYFFVFFIFFPVHVLFSQHFVNNGNGVVINQGAWLVIGGNYINQTAGQDGFVEIDGKMVVMRDFINNSGHEVFINIESVPDGEVILKGTVPQNICGTTPTRFENLTVRNSRKTLETNFCQVAGKLHIDAIFDLHSNTFVIDNSSTAGITYQSGYIYAETTPAQGLGIINWSISGAHGGYSIPFGSSQTTGKDLELQIHISSSGSDEGFYSFSTYPANSMNIPFPSTIFTLSPFSPEMTVNRFWLVQANYGNKPSASIIFTYDYLSAIDVNRNTLKAIRHNTLNNSWNDWGPAGTPNAAGLSVTTPIVHPSHFFSWWTLTGNEENEYVYIPNAFTPNNDGLNDEFKPIISGFEPEEYYFYVFDRWGAQIFESKNPNHGWNGRLNNNECKQDVYVWLFMYRDMYNKMQTKTGIVTLIK